MKNCKWLAVFIVLTMALLSASASYGQTVLNAVGSSGAFGSVSISMVSPDPITGAAALCGTNAWSTGGSTPSSLSLAVDTRGGAIHNEPGNLFVSWDNDLAPTRICTYMSVDSIVGERLFFEQGPGVTGNGKLQLGASAQYTLTSNKVAFVQDNLLCSASNGPLTFSVDLTYVGTTMTVTPHGGGNFSNEFAIGSSVTLTDAGNAANNFAGNPGGIGGLGPASWTYTDTTAGAATDLTGTASVTVVQNCPGLPAAVYNALVASPHFTLAFTDIRPEDALFASLRAINPLNPNDPASTNLGYGSKGILSSYSQGVAYPVLYGITGTDPISGTAIPAYVTSKVGAQAVVQIVNNTDVSACGLGNPAFTSVSWQALYRAYEGLAGATQDLSPALISSVPGCPKTLWPVVREPLSGTFNTREWQIDRPNANRTGSQENYNVGYPQSNNNAAPCAAWVAALPATLPANPTFPPDNGGGLEYGANNCGNPLNIQLANYTTATPAAGPYGGYGGNRTRAIGNGEMVSVINSTNTPNSLGYAFYSLGTFGGKVRVKYVMLDNADPLWPSYKDNPYGPGNLATTCTGKVNLGTFSCPLGLPTFDGLVGGGYRNWNILQAVYYGAAPATCASPFTTLGAGCLVQAAQDQARSSTKDFVPTNYCGNAACTTQPDGMPFFRSHYQNSGVVPHDGNQPPSGACVGLVPNEAGGDMAGQIFMDQADFTLQNNIGCSSELTNLFQ